MPPLDVVDVFYVIRQSAECEGEMKSVEATESELEPTITFGPPSMYQKPSASEPSEPSSPETHVRCLRRDAVSVDRDWSGVPLSMSLGSQVVPYQ